MKRKEIKRWFYVFWRNNLVWSILLSLLFIILFFPIVVNAQEKKLYFKRITTENGLSNSIVNSIAQDKYGFMWFGTADGLCRYDGKNCMVFRNNTADTYSLLSNKITTLLYDSKNRFWVGTDIGLNLFDPITNKCTHFQHDSTNQNSLGNNTINALYEDHDGQIWIGAQGLNSLNPETNKITRYPPSPNNPFAINKNTTGATIQDASGKFWVGTWDDLIGIDTFRVETGKFYTMPFKGRDKRFGNLSPELVSCIFEDSKHNLWFGCFTGLYYYDWQTKQFTYYHYYDTETYFSAAINTIAEDNFGNIWLGTTGNGIFIFDTETQKWHHFMNNPENANSLSDNRVNCIFKDKTGTIWIATKNGVSVVDAFTNQFGVLHYDADKSQEYNIAQSTMLEDNNGNFWTDITIGIRVYGGSEMGFTIFDRKTQRFSPPQMPKFNNVQDIEMRNEEIWISEVHNIYALKDKKKFSSIQLSDTVFTTEFLFFDKMFPNYFWTVNSQGLFMNNIKTGFPEKIYSSIHQKQEGTISLSGSNSKKMIVDKTQPTYWLSNIYFDDKTQCVDYQQYLWIRSGTEKTGYYLYLMNKTNGEIKPIRPDTLKDVTSIFKTRNNQLYVGCKNGLYSYHPQNKSVTYYGDVLPPQSVLGIIEDRQSKLWIAYAFGILRFDPQTKQVWTFNFQQDIPTVKEIPTYFRQVTHFGNVTQQVYIATVDGVLHFRPEQIIYNLQPPQVYITDFKIHNQSVVFDTAMFAKKEIVLEYNQNFFTIRFAALNYSNSEKNKYQYKLEGIDNDWISTKNNEAPYTSVRHGKYIFKVKGSNNKGIWNEAETTLEIIVLPPWWFTWWAYSIYFILTVLIVYGIVKLNTVRLQKEKQRLETIVEKRTYELKEANVELHKQKEEIESQAEELENQLNQISELSSYKERMTQMLVHDIKNPLQNIININTNEQLTSQSDLVKYSANRIFNLVLNILDISKFKKTDLPLNIVSCTLSQIIKNALTQLKFISEQKRIEIEVAAKDFELQADENIVERIFVNILSNALKYTPNNGHIKIYFETTNDNMVKITIEDNGSGIETEDISQIFDEYYQSKNNKISFSTGLGLTFCKIAVEAHKGKIGIESQKEVGTKVIFTLPYMKTVVLEEKKEQPIGTLALNATEKLQLLPYHPLLASLKVFEISALRKILKEVENNECVNKQWITEMRNAVYSGNKAIYEELVEMIKS